MKKSLLLVSLSLSLLIALSGCNKDVKVSEIDVENKPVSRSIAAEPTAEEDTPMSSSTEENTHQPQSQPSADTPVGMRKFLNYNGFRYAFVEDGKSFDFSSLTLGDELGTLEYDIVAGMASGQSVSDKEFSASFAVGGQLYAHPDYDPAFRLIVKLDDQYYLAELVGKTDNTTIEPDYFFEHSKLSTTATGCDILNHIGNTTFSSLDSEDAKAMLEIISTSTAAELASSDYEQIASAQSEGKSYQLHVTLPDSTYYSMYLLPELGLISIGDDYYRLPDSFSQNYSELFSSLPTQTPPLN